MNNTVTRAYVRALKENYTAIASAERSRPKVPFIRFKVMEEVGLTVMKGFGLADEQDRELSDLIVVMHTSMLESANAELMRHFKSVTQNTDGSITPNTPEHRPVRPENVITTFMTSIHLIEKLVKQKRHSAELKDALSTEDDMRAVLDDLTHGRLLPTPAVIMSGTNLLWKLSPPYMFHVLGEDKHSIFALRYRQAGEFLAEMESTEQRGR